MEKQQKTFFNFKEQSTENVATKQPQETKYTFLLPFIVASALVTPSLLVLAYVRPTVGFAALTALGYFSIIQVLLTLLVVIAVLSGLVYLIRAQGKAGRVAVGLVMAGLVVCFAYAGVLAKS
jgi:lysylphosphatidylglycerol synthetase-like protein (DUF2156 family)